MSFLITFKQPNSHIGLWMLSMSSWRLDLQGSYWPGYFTDVLSFLSGGWFDRKGVNVCSDESTKELKKNAYLVKSTLKKSKETPLMGTTLCWVKTCPALLQMIANQDLKATLPPEARILNPISVQYRDANIVAKGLQSASGAVGIIEWLPRWMETPQRCVASMRPSSNTHRSPSHCILLFPLTLSLLLSHTLSLFCLLAFCSAFSLSL